SLQFRHVQIFDYAGIADFDGENESADPSYIFLVGASCCNQLGGAKVECGKGTVEMNQVLKARGLCAGNAFAPMCDVECGNHAPAHRFTMQQCLVACCLFNGVANRVAEIQDHTQAVFALIAIDDRGFHADRCGDDF